MLPVTENAQAAEGSPLDVNEAFGKFRAAAADFSRVQVPDLLHHLEFDGEAVAVPARNVGGGVAGHGLGLQDEVLENLVQGSAHVHVSVGKGRSVVKEETGCALFYPAGQNSFVQPGVFPLFQAYWFVFRQVPSHGEAGLRQQDGVFIILFGRTHARKR